MKYTVKPNFFTIAFLLIIGAALFREFDSETGSFQKPALAVVYIFALILNFIFMIKKRKKE